MDSPGDKHGEDAVAPGNRFLDDLAVVRCSRYDGDAPLERVEFPDALFPAHAHDLVASVKRVLGFSPTLPLATVSAALDTEAEHPQK